MGTEEKKEEKEYNAYKRELRINDDCGLNRKLEEVGEFNKSYFRDNYYDAFVLTQKILEQNDIWESGKERCGGDAGQDRLYNIITFCGERGTGKTSVMDSIVRALRSETDEYGKFIKAYEKRDGKKRGKSAEVSDLSRMLNKYEFICLEGIDASLLEGKEELLDVVLSKMLQKLRKNIEKRDYLWCAGTGSSYNQEEIYRKFEEIYQSRRKLLWRMDNLYEPGESSAEQLSNLAGSLDIREKLQKLVPMYLKALRTEKEKDRQYLVINIDDLDMHGSAYQMLEQLHRYLMIPQVIIYIAVSEREIKAVCKKYFAEIYDSPAELAMSYLEKVLPYSQRIYLPSTFSGDFFSIITGDDPKLDRFSVKEYILREIAKRTQVFYDAWGLETHFYEIWNLRTLFNFYYLLKGMPEIEKESLFLGNKNISEEEREILDSNFDKLKNDVIGRMVAEKLKDNEQLRIFKEYYREDFSSSGEYLIEQIIKIIDKDKNEGKNKDRKKSENKDKEEFVKKYQMFGYGYGMVLNALYTLGKEGQEFKPLIQCVLAIASIELTQNYIYTFYTEEITSRQKWKENISGSLCGNWGNQMLPKVKGQNKAEGRKGDGSEGETKDKQKCLAYVKTKISEGNIQLKLSECLNVSADSRGFEVCKNLIDNEALVESFELFMTFITKKSGITSDGYDISMEYLRDSDNSKEMIELKLDGWECTFDILGMIVNVIDYEGEGGIDYKEYFKKIDKMLLHVMEEYCTAKEEELTVEQKKELEDKIKEKSMKEVYEIWDELYGRLALPLYSMDIMYNILKRVKKKMKKELPEAVGVDEFLPGAERFYVLIKEELEKEDEFYSKETGNAEESPIKFYKRFYFYPFIHPFIKEAEKEDRKDSEKAEQIDKHEKLVEKLLKEPPEMFKQLFNGFVKILANT